MAQINWQVAATDAFQACLQNSLTAPMSMNELCITFGLGFRQMKAHLGEIDGVVRAGSCYRIPLKMMPSEFISSMQGLQ